MQLLMHLLCTMLRTVNSQVDVMCIVPFISTARCSSSRNSLRGITHSPSPHFGGGATTSFDGIFGFNLQHSEGSEKLQGSNGLLEGYFVASKE